MLFLAFSKTSYVIIVKLYIKLILGMFIRLSGYVIQIMHFVINTEYILHSWIKSNNSIMYCFLYTTNSLFLKLFLKVGLRCNFLLFLRFETGSLASETENVKLFRPHSGAEMGQWVKRIFLGSLYIWVWIAHFHTLWR